MQEQNRPKTNQYRCKWTKSLHVRFVLIQLLVAFAVIGSTIIILVTIERSVLLNQGYDLAEQLGNYMVANLQKQIVQAESMTMSLAKLGESLPQDEQLFKQVIPQLLDAEGQEKFIAGGGIWPEPRTFSSDLDRRSFFWGRTDDGELKYFDEYNDPDGLGYHQREWYVPSLFSPPGTSFWSQSYMDPFSYQPMVTCTVPMYRNGKVSGVATVDVKLEGLDDFFRKASVSTGGYIFSVDRNNKFITFPRPAWVTIKTVAGDDKTAVDVINASQLAKKEPTYTPIVKILDDINDSLINRMTNGNGELAKKIFSKSNQINEKEAGLIAAMLSARNKNYSADPINSIQLFLDNDPLLNEPVNVMIFKVPETFWKIVVITPTSKFYSMADSITLEIAMYIVLLEVTGLCIMFYVTKNLFINPIRKIARRLRNQTGNDYLALNTLDDIDHNELGQLAFAFNQRTNRLIRITMDLEEHILDQKKAEDALRTSEENLKITLNSIGDGVIATNSGGNISTMNPIAEQLTGWDIDEAKGKPFLDIFKAINTITGKEFENLTNRILEKQDAFDVSQNVELINRNNETYAITLHGAPIRNYDGGIVGIVIVFRDVSKQKLMEEQLRHSHKMESLGQLSGGIAHDFNNMLAGMMSGADMILRKPNDPKMLDKYANIIIDTAKKASELTNKLLAFSRKGKLDNRPMDVHCCINATLNLLERSIDKGISITDKLNAKHSMIIGDSTQLQNVFLNLGLNARDAMSDSGELVFSTKNFVPNTQFQEFNQLAMEAEEYIEITVRDSGIGMSHEIKSKIFEPFFTTKEIGKGTGLGLSAVYGTIIDHNGIIMVDSKLGDGTTFKIYLPVSTQEAAPLIEQDIGDTNLSEGCILLIDDEPVVRTMIMEMLNELGYRVIEADNGEVGIDMFTKYKNTIDLVILDMIMPKMNGTEAFKQLRLIDDSVKVIISSGYSKDRTMKEFNSGGVEFIQKPYRIKEIEDLLKQVLSTKKEINS